MVLSFFVLSCGICIANPAEGVLLLTVGRMDFM